MSLFSYFWGSETHLEIFSLVFESAAAFVEVLIAVWIWKTVKSIDSEPTEEKEHKKESLEATFALIAAVFVLVAVFSVWRILILHNRSEKDSEAVFETQSNKLAQTESLLKIATNDVAQIDPHNLPIMSLSGWIRLEIRPIPGIQDDGKHFSVVGAHNSQLRDKGATNLETASLELGPYGQSVTNRRFLEKSGVVGSKAISKNDSGDCWERFDLYFEADGFLFNFESLTANEINVLKIDIPRWSSEDSPFSHSVVVGGQAEFVINSSLPKKFIIPPQTNFSQIATSVATNGTFIPLKLSFGGP